jgi:hypothetical protein
VAVSPVRGGACCGHDSPETISPHTGVISCAWAVSVVHCTSHPVMVKRRRNGEQAPATGDDVQLQGEGARLSCGCPAQRGSSPVWRATGRGARRHLCGYRGTSKARGNDRRPPRSRSRCDGWLDRDGREDEGGNAAEDERRPVILRRPPWRRQAPTGGELGGRRPMVTRVGARGYGPTGALSRAPRFPGKGARLLDARPSRPIRGGQPSPAARRCLASCGSGPRPDGSPPSGRGRGQEKSARGFRRPSTHRRCGRRATEGPLEPRQCRLWPLKCAPRGWYPGAPRDAAGRGTRPRPNR